MNVRKDLRVRDRRLVGQIPRHGTVVTVKGAAVRVHWEDEHEPSVVGPVIQAKRASGS
jgi:hypothetical protein